jgi:hypothetical protein
MDVRPSPEADRPDVLTSSILPLEQLARRGAEVAGETTTAPKPEDEAALREFAATAADDAFQEAYDPGVHPHDRVEEDTYQRSVRDQEDAETARALAVTQVHQRREEHAALERNIAKPVPNAVVILTSVTTIALSISPTLHDRLFWTLSDSTAWLISALLGGFVGALVAWMLVGTYDAGHRTPASIAGLVAGIGVGIAAFLMRIGDATTGAEISIALGLSVLEISTVAFLEFNAARLRQDYTEWREYSDTIHRAEKLVNAAEAELADRVAHVERLNEQIRDHRRYVETRHIRFARRKELTAAAAAAAIRGYREQINRNGDRRRGVYRRFPQVSSNGGSA